MNTCRYVSVWQLIGTRMKRPGSQTRATRGALEIRAFTLHWPKRQRRAANSISRLLPNGIKITKFLSSERKVHCKSEPLASRCRRFYVIKSKNSNWPNRTEGCEPDKPNDFFMPIIYQIILQRHWALRIRRTWSARLESIEASMVTFGVVWADKRRSERR